MKHSQNLITRTFNKARLNSQAGVSSLTIVATLAVGALVLAGGSTAFKYIEQQKANNDMAELSDIRAGLIDFASKHNTTYTGFTLEIGCRQGIFPATRCSGAAATTAVSNIWGGTYTFTITNVASGTNNGLRLGSSVMPDSACIKEISYLWDQFVRIEVGTTVVKSTATAAIDDAGINTACSNGANTVFWTVRA